MGIERALRITHRRLMVPGGAVDIASGNHAGPGSEITERLRIVGAYGIKAGPERFGKRIRNVVETANINIVQRLRRSGCRCVDKENKETPACRSRFCEKKRASTQFRLTRQEKPTAERRFLRIVSNNQARLVRASVLIPKQEASKVA